MVSYNIKGNNRFWKFDTSFCGFQQVSNGENRRSLIANCVLELFQKQRRTLYFEINSGRDVLFSLLRKREHRFLQRLLRISSINLTTKVITHYFILFWKYGQKKFQCYRFSWCTTLKTSFKYEIIEVEDQSGF